MHAAPFSPCGSGSKKYRPRDTLPDHPDVAVESIAIRGGEAPGTPAVLNKSIFLRVRSAACSPNRPAKVDCLVIGMPGFAGTALSFSEFAAQMVEKAQQFTCDGKPCQLKVWVIDRRGNGLEKTQGGRLGRAANDPFKALSYYFGPHILDQTTIPASTGMFDFPVDTIKPAGLFPAQASADQLVNAPGAKFHPLVEADVPFEADWGFEAAAEDLDALPSWSSAKTQPTTFSWPAIPRQAHSSPITRAENGPTEARVRILSRASSSSMP